MRIRVAAILLLSAAWAGPAFADPSLGFYAGIYGGPSTSSDSDFTFALDAAELATGPIDTFDIDNDDDEPIDPGFLEFLDDLEADFPGADTGIGISLHAGGVFEMLTAPHAGAIFGYGFGNGLRVEADLSTSSHSVGGFTIDSAGYQIVVDESDDGSLDWDVYMAGEIVGDIVPLTDLADLSLSYATSSRFVLANAWYDFDTGTAFTPYLGAGVGFAQITGTLSSDNAFNSISDSAIVPAGQLGAGVRMAVSGPLTLDLGYRLRVAGDPDLRLVEGGGGAPLALRVEQTGPIVMHAVQIGLTYAFE